MSRDNFIMKLTDKEKLPVYVMIHNITAIEDTKEGSLIFLIGKKDPVLVEEKVEEMIKKGSLYGILKVIV